MYEKVIVVVFVMLALNGCATRARSKDVTRLAVAGEHEITVAEQQNQKFRDISRQLGEIENGAREQLDGAITDVSELEDIISRIFGIAYGLLDKISNLRAEVERIQKMDTNNNGSDGSL